MLIGFSTYSGTVTAASNWGDPAERKRVRPALPGRYEALFHGAGIPRFVLALRDGGHVAEGLREPLLERAIGVIYLPETERASHYFVAQLSSSSTQSLTLMRHGRWNRSSAWVNGEPERSRNLPSGV